jgi:hypothetical protein
VLAVELDERAGRIRIAQVPVEVRSGEVTAQAPGVAIVVGADQGRGGLADVVDVVALPRVVLEQWHR